MDKLPDILAEIIAHKRAELERAVAAAPQAELQRRAAEAPRPRDLVAALSRAPRGPVRVLAEVKRRSPSAGLIRGEFDAASLGARLATAGADAISVLTDEKYFGGRLDDLRAVAGAVAVPVLRKDFIVEAYQVWEARAWGADAYLLIADALESPALEGLVTLGRQLGMEPLVESHSESALERALACGATLIGINNRDLRTFRVDLGTAERLAARVPRDRILVAESGINSSADVARMLAAGAQAVLVGESLMRADDPAERIAEFKSAK